MTTETEVLADRVAHAFHEGNTDEWNRILSEHAAVPGAVATLNAIAIGVLIGDNARHHKMKKQFDARLDAMRAIFAERLANLQAGLTYVGQFETGKTYRRGSIATDAGGLYLCREDTSAAPGHTMSWLMVLPVGADTSTADLERRMAALETKSSISYQGVWDATKIYAIGDVVSDHGSAWIAKVPTSQRPDEHSPGGTRDWQLMVKRGANGRDGRDRP